ncbi:MAG: hypothetical protein ACK5IN_10445 [Microbacterium sp.]|uniref:hypothetical protein n=1 Tax=Microbacterium sp. TaxID=51671 RepID=UPI003A8B63F2
MLTLTENAATVVEGIVVQNAGTDESGLRIAGADDPRAGFALTLASREESDDVVEESGATCFSTRRHTLLSLTVFSTPRSTTRVGCGSNSPGSARSRCLRAGTLSA